MKTPSASTVSMPRTTTIAMARAAHLLLAGALGIGMLAANAQRDSLTVEKALQVLVGWSFVGCGVFLWSRRPANRLGLLMTTVGMVWLLGRTMTLSAEPVVYTAGIWLTDLWGVAFVAFLLAFPTGRLTSRADF